MSKLYIVPTPIGNLEDITLRAIRILKEVDLIIAEDTRKSSILLKHYEINNKITSYHKFNEHKLLNSIIDKLLSGTTIALITDAGTPSISDPGFLLVRECVEKQIVVECLPGATAFVPALVNSGLSSDKFVFEGFLNHKKGLNKRLALLAEEKRTIIIYESPYKLIKTIELLMQYFGNERKACISRELTKIYEENIKGTLNEILEYYKNKDIKGECVIIIEGKLDKKNKMQELVDNE